jgi:hypothetical protein
MAKKKSKWIKANAETARELDASRERRDREERTGGSLRAKTDGLLFAIDRTKGGAREAKVRDGLLTSVRRTMVGTNTKPAKLAHPRKGQTVYADAKVRTRASASCHDRARRLGVRRRLTRHICSRPARCSPPRSTSARSRSRRSRRGIRRRPSPTTRGVQTTPRSSTSTRRQASS